MDLGSTGLSSMVPKVKNENNMDSEERETRMRVRRTGNKCFSIVTWQIAAYISDLQFLKADNNGFIQSHIQQKSYLIF